MAGNFVNICDAFETIADNHKQIHSYGFGDIANIATSGTINYAMMWVLPQGSTVRRGEVGYQFQILIMDLLRKDQSNLVDVLNDTHRIALDVLAELAITGQDFQPTANAFQLKFEDVTMSDFIDRFDEEVAGWTMNITLWTAWDWDKCDIPD